jgi:hypothetical protein
MLGRDPELLAVVREAAVAIPKLVPGARLRLGVLVDPEDGIEDMVLRVVPGLSFDAALRALGSVDREWWFPIAKRAPSLVVTLGYS